LGNENDIVLEIGTQLGYVTMLLAKMATHVYSVEPNAELLQTATQNLAQHSITNATLEVGNAVNGWPKHAPYDVIFASGSYPEALPFILNSELKVGGRCFAITGKAPAMQAKLFTNNGEIEERILFETMVPGLMNEPRPSTFIF